MAKKAYRESSIERRIEIKHGSSIYQAAPAIARVANEQRRHQWHGAAAYGSSGSESEVKASESR